jgi:hypothetical protein
VFDTTLEHRRRGRREFLAALSAVAATGVLSAGGAASGTRGDVADGGMPTIDLGGQSVSRLMVGSNPILGYSYMGQHTDRQMRDYFTPDRTVEFLADCEAAGITAHQFGYSDRSVEYLRLLRGQGSKLKLVCLHSGRDGIDEALQTTHPFAVAHHGGVTDRLFAEGKFGVVNDYVKAVKDRGLLAGVSAHNPDCIKRVADEGWEVDFFMTCFYFLTRRGAGKEEPVSTLEIGYPFFKNDPQVMTRVMREVEHPCLAFKILGGGRLCSNQETVRSAFQFAFENIKPIDAVIVGMFPWYFDEVGANAGYARELAPVRE